MFASNEDPAPTEGLGGEGSPSDMPDSDDPTTGPEHDDGPDALRAFLAAEEAAETDTSVESAEIPPVTWAPDRMQPDFAHSLTPAAASVSPTTVFDFGPETLDLLVGANRFRPRGKNGLIAYGLRGGRLLGADAQENVRGIQIEDVRPDHTDFRCTLGIYDTAQRRISAFVGSTVPNRHWMRNYFKIRNGIRPHSSTRCNLLPTGCYIFRVNAHKGGKIKPALRMTDPDNLAADATCTVLRTFSDLSYTHDDFYDRTQPFDNIHCAYSDSEFSSAGCQTIKGADGDGPWGAFQAIIGALGWNARIDYVLLTGREAAIAAAILAAGRNNDAALVEAALGRLRVGSEGDAVTALQRKLGFNGSAYFGPATRQRLTQAEASGGLDSDGVYSPADDLATGWSVFGAPPSALPVNGDPPGPVATAPAPAVNALNLRISGQPDGTAQLDPGAVGKIRIRHAGDARKMTFAAQAILTVGGAALPVSIDVQLDGLPPASSGVTLETTIAAIPATEAHESDEVGTVAQPIDAPSVTGSSAPGLAADTLDAFAPGALSGYRNAILSDGHAALGPLGIDATARRLSHFLAQIGHESGGFRLRTESLNYTSARRICEVWPRRFPTEAEAAPFVRNEEALANKVYGDRLGNNQPGDGFRYRGRGLIQLTGRGAYREYSERLGIDLVGDPDLAFDPRIALRIAATFWSSRKLPGERPMNALADDDKLRAITYRINGGFTNFAHREAELARAKAIFGGTGDAAPRPRIVERGDFDDMVRRLQLALVEIGLLAGTVDGKFGKNTYDALRKFKAAAGLDGVGYADAATFQALRDHDPLGLEGIEEIGEIPVIGDDPEPIREGISLDAEGAATS